MLDEHGGLIDEQLAYWADRLQGFAYDVLVVGHTHQVFAQRVANTLVINPRQYPVQSQLCRAEPAGAAGRVVCPVRPDAAEVMELGDEPAQARVKRRDLRNPVGLVSAI